MRKEMQDLLKRYDFCVMATESDGKPHCSLMAYICDADCQYVYMVTDKKTAKFRNLKKNPAVSLLVDTRETHGAEHRSQTQALTVAGVYEPLQEEMLPAIRDMLLETHPQLSVFLKDPDARILSVRLESFLLLDGLTEATYEAV
ncbi:MAG: pyridoxamine 5'-phosphate oxidase family protein [Deltaproteobacteria bacterium]|nr:pyridoxamine 5'-phosphate oxidase family protein [Deltaproteobacteria bacterium]